MAGGGEYSWVMTDTGWRYTGPGPAPGCGPGCCGGCRTRQSRLSFDFPDKNKYNYALDRPNPNFMSNYVTKQELQDAFIKVYGVCDMSVDKENSARCNKPRGHVGFCDRI